MSGNETLKDIIERSVIKDLSKPLDERLAALDRATTGYRRRPAALPRKRSRVTIFNVNGRPVFDLILYGVDRRDLMLVRAEKRKEGDFTLIGGEIVRAALQRRGLNPDDFMASPFFIGEP